MLFIKLNLRLNEYIPKNSKTTNVSGEEGSKTDEGTPGPQTIHILQAIENYFLRESSDSPIEEQGQKSEEGTPGDQVIKKRVYNILDRIKLLYGFSWPKYPSGEKIQQN